MSNLYQTCRFPSSYIFDIYYSKINTKSNPQYQIIKATHRAESNVKQTFKQGSKDQKQDFEVTLNINYYEVEQEAELYLPRTPNPVKPLGRNILYPFYIYGSAVTQAATCLALVFATMFVSFGM